MNSGAKTTQTQFEKRILSQKQHKHSSKNEFGPKKQKKKKKASANTTHNKQTIFPNINK